MKRCDRTPVGTAEKPAWAKARRLHETGAPIHWFQRPLEPCLTGEAHLRVEHEQPIGVEILHAPEVDGLADRQGVGMAAPTPEAGPTCSVPPVQPGSVAAEVKGLDNGCSWVPALPA